MRSTKKRKIIYRSRNISQFNCLPQEIVELILSYVELPSIIALASCNHLLSTLIYETCNGLWSSLDFSELPNNFRLTDKCLKNFLKRINAQENTRYLSIQNCSAIQGYGLEPLRSSTVLHTIDLRVVPFDKNLNSLQLDEAYIVQLLYSMIPVTEKTRSSKMIVAHIDNLNFTLSHVVFRQSKLNRYPTYYKRFNPVTNEFLLNFHKLLKMRAETKNWCCQQCNHILSTKNFETSQCQRCILFDCVDCYEKAQCVSCKYSLCSLCQVSSKCYFDKFCKTPCKKRAICMPVLS